MDSTDFIRIFPVYILVYMNRINYMYKGTGKTFRWKRYKQGK